MLLQFFKDKNIFVMKFLYACTEQKKFILKFFEV